MQEGQASAHLTTAILPKHPFPKVAVSGLARYHRAARTRPRPLPTWSFRGHPISARAARRERAPVSILCRITRRPSEPPPGPAAPGTGRHLLQILKARLHYAYKVRNFVRFTRSSVLRFCVFGGLQTAQKCNDVAIVCLRWRATDWIRRMPMDVESGRGTWGTRPPQSKNQRGTSPQKLWYVFGYLFLDTFANSAFSNIFEIKWPKPEEKLNFGGRWAWVPMNLSPKQNLVATPLWMPSLLSLLDSLRSRHLISSLHLIHLSICHLISSLTSQKYFSINGNLER